MTVPAIVTLITGIAIGFAIGQRFTSVKRRIEIERATYNKIKNRAEMFYRMAHEIREGSES